MVTTRVIPTFIYDTSNEFIIPEISWDKIEVKGPTGITEELLEASVAAQYIQDVLGFKLSKRLIDIEYDPKDKNHVIKISHAKADIVSNSDENEKLTVLFISGPIYEKAILENSIVLINDEIKPPTHTNYTIQ